MTNRYPGKCTKCGQTVNPERGTCEKVNGKWVVQHTECPEPQAAAPVAADTVTIRKGECYGGREYKPGQVVSYKDGWWVVVKASKRYYDEDGMSMGVGDEEGYVYSATIRPATDDEAAPMIAKAAEAAARKAQEARRTEVAEQIKATGERPEGMRVPEGETYSDRRTIYGGGDWFVVNSERIWYVQNNGADGDDWRRNNVRTGGAGAIGWRIPYDEALAAEIKQFPA